MITDEHAWASIKMFFSFDYFKVDAGCEGHCIVEAPSGGPLCDVLLSEEAEDDGGDDTVGCTD